MMGWGGSSGGQGAREVAKAFYEGRPLKRGNARTDGRTYWLFDNPIARHAVDPTDVTELVTQKLLGYKITEFSWAGWPTATTEAHLEALGIDAWKGSESQRRPRKPTLCGKPVEAYGWYTREEAAALPAYVAPPKRPVVRFVNLTRPLFA